jgi:sugar O-acyltransferase (sialic acid O-acetyltransferase NeuD family)
MLIVGAGGFAKEILETFHAKKETKNLVFFDETITSNDKLFGQFNILKTEEEVSQYFNHYGNQFTIGIGNPMLRYNMINRFTRLGGELKTTISPSAEIGSYDVKIGDGCNILQKAILSNSCQIGIGCIVYYNAVITHDCQIGNFVEISPSANILGKVTIGDFSRVGANATILPKITIGKNVTIAAGAVVTTDVPDNTMVAGVPAIIKKQLDPINI